MFSGSRQIAQAGGGTEIFADHKLASTKLTHHFHLHRYGFDISIFGGIKKIFDAYQNDFDIGKNTDVNYIFGPQQSRTFLFVQNLKPE